MTTATKTPKTLTLERRIRARPETVFEFFVDPEKYRLWQGIEAMLEPVPGGRYRVQYARHTAVRGRYLVIEPPRRLVFTWGWEPSPEPVLGIHDVPPDSTTVEITLVPDGEDTILQLRHSGLPTTAAEMMHGTAWPFYLDRLATAATGGDAGLDPVFAGIEN